MHFDYSYDGTMRSFEDSLQRLGLEQHHIGAGCTLQRVGRAHLRLRVGAREVQVAGLDQADGRLVVAHCELVAHAAQEFEAPARQRDVHGRAELLPDRTGR